MAVDLKHIHIITNLHIMCNTLSVKPIFEKKVLNFSAFFFVIGNCDIITALSNQISLTSTLQNRFIRFMSKCLSSSNCILKLISHFAISNPISAARKITDLL